MRLAARIFFCANLEKLCYNFNMEELITKIQEQQAKIDAIYISVEKLRKYFMWTLIVTVATVLVPLIAIIFILPSLIGSITAMYQQ